MTVDFNAIANQGVNDLQTAIGNLNKLKRQPGADIPRLIAKIEALQAQQTNLRTMALVSAEESPENQAAIAAINAVATDLKSEAENITSVAAAFNTADKVMGYAVDLATSLATFAV